MLPVVHWMTRIGAILARLELVLVGVEVAVGEQLAKGRENAPVLLAVGGLLAAHDVLESGDAHPYSCQRLLAGGPRQIGIAVGAVRHERDVQIAESGGQVPDSSRCQ